MVKIIGIIIILIGAVDLGGSYFDFDLWGGFLGIELPELLWRYSSYIEIALGLFIMSLGSSKKSTDEAETTEASEPPKE